MIIPLIIVYLIIWCVICLNLNFNLVANSTSLLYFSFTPWLAAWQCDGLVRWRELLVCVIGIPDPASLLLTGITDVWHWYCWPSLATADGELLMCVIGIPDPASLLQTGITGVCHRYSWPGLATADGNYWCVALVFLTQPRYCWQELLVCGIGIPDPASLLLTGITGVWHIGIPDPASLLLTCLSHCTLTVWFIITQWLAPLQCQLY